MDIQKAIKELQSRIDLFEEDYRLSVPEYGEALKMAVSALEKQVPRKPVEDKYHNYHCPACGWIGWGEKYVPHCEKCGQAIDWSGERGEAKNSIHEGDAGQV